MKTKPKSKPKPRLLLEPFTRMWIAYDPTVIVSPFYPGETPFSAYQSYMHNYKPGKTAANAVIRVRSKDNPNYSFEFQWEHLMDDSFLKRSRKAIP